MVPTADSSTNAYAYLQKAVGLIAVTLPFVVAIGNDMSGGHGLKGSISAYYYTHLGNYFVGSLFALGVFFLSYNYRPLPDYRVDNYLSNVAAAMAVGVALFPTSSDGAEATGGGEREVMRLVRLRSAVPSALAGLRIAAPAASVAEEMRSFARPKSSTFACPFGVIITFAIVMILVTEIVKPSKSLHALFWLESIAVVSFGISWLVKGGFLGVFADHP